MTTETTRHTSTTNHKICGCRVSCLGDQEHEPRITYCPIHAAAPEMAEALSILVGHMAASRHLYAQEWYDDIARARALLRRLEG